MQVSHDIKESLITLFAVWNVKQAVELLTPLRSLMQTNYGNESESKQFITGYLASGEDATSMPTDNVPLPKSKHKSIQMNKSILIHICNNCNPNLTIACKLHVSSGQLDILTCNKSPLPPLSQLAKEF